MAGIKGQQRKAWESYLNEFNNVHGQYTYQKPSVSNFSRQKTDICCTKHGWFKQRLQDHRRGSICPQCNNENRTYRRRIPVEEFVKRANNIHNGYFKYDSQTFTNMRTKMSIRCPEHGWFSQLPHDHQNGAGCPQCKSEKLSSLYTKSFAEFVNDSRKVHGDRYSYNEDKFIDRQHFTTITCSEHGDFEKRPSDHIHSEIGCPICSAKNFVSKLETEWLDAIDLPNDNEHRQVWIDTITGKKKVDGFEPTTNTVYLFHGDYWHGNPRVYKAEQKNPNVKKTFGNLFAATNRYERDITNSGYNIIVMWESDFRK